MNDQKKSIGALWTRISKSGTEYLSGTINGVKVVVYKNNYKKEEKQPDFRIYESTAQTQSPKKIEDDFNF